MIKAIILDVDGVIIGEKIGYNSPHPHPDVVTALKKVREKGIAICLCTAKPHYSISEEIKAPNLHNPHIADAGAVIIDPIDKIIVEKHVLDNGLVKEILQTLRDASIYVEFYTVDDYFIQLCGYGATLANGTDELKELISKKGEGKSFVSNGSVDENGILEILNYFSR